MKNRIRLIRLRNGLYGAAAVCVSVSAASAAVIGTDAIVTTTVQELIDGSPGSVSSDTARLDSDNASLPLAASGDLTSTDLDGALVSMGQAFSEFSDPARLDQPNPEEFALEVGCYSNATSVAYNVTSEAEEFRTIVFTRPGSEVAPPEIDFGLTSNQAVESRIFLSGAILFWSTAPGRSLDDVIGDVAVTVTREDTGATLFETTLAVTGQDESTVRPASTGPIRFEIVTLDDLRDEGVDAETVAVLESVERSGTLVIVVIPPQEHPYTYMVTADVPMVLAATLTARVRNVPDGTGAAVALGAPFGNLADFIEPGLPGVDGTALQRSINLATASREIGFVPAAASTISSPRLCGAFGVEGVALGILAFFMTLTRRLH